MFRRRDASIMGIFSTWSPLIVSVYVPELVNLTHFWLELGLLLCLPETRRAGPSDIRLSKSLPRTRLKTDRRVLGLGEVQVEHLLIQ